MVELEEITAASASTSFVRHLRLRATRELYFDELVPDGSTRVFIVVTFLAVLEMIRRGELRVSQEQPRGRIQLRLSMPEEARAT